MDDTGAAALSGYLGYAEKYGVGLMLARVHSGTHKILDLAGFVDELGEERIYDTVRNAVDAAVTEISSPTSWTGSDRLVQRTASLSRRRRVLAVARR